MVDFAWKHSSLQIGHANKHMYADVWLLDGIEWEPGARAAGANWKIDCDK